MRITFFSRGDWPAICFRTGHGSSVSATLVAILSEFIDRLMCLA
jgi:hypothetical protein